MGQIYITERAVSHEGKSYFSCTPADLIPPPFIPWLKENYDYEVICCCIDCGQEEELDGLEERAISCGASKLYIVDIIDEFCDDYIMPCVQANAIYENKYLLGTSMARPLIAKKLVEIARKEGAVAICHGATGKGNDQIVSNFY